jgi:hypothetical protein
MPRGSPTILGVAAVLAALAVAAPAVAATAGTAEPAPAGERRAIAGGERIVQLSDELDRDAAMRMHPGDEVSWLVTVSATRDDGRIDVSLNSPASSEDFTVTLRECAMAWTRDGGCPAQERDERILPVGQRSTLGSLPSSERRWYRLDVALDADAPRAATARLVVHAAGWGTSEPGRTGPDALAPTGGDVVGLFGPAAMALAVGLGLAAAGRRGRRDVPTTERVSAGGRAAPGRTGRALEGAV